MSLATAWQPSPNHEPRKSGPTDILLLHYTGMDTAEGACRWLCNPESRVSAHYLVHENGAVTQMVDEAYRAWHAGVAFWAGETDINSRSVGIEIHNGGPFSDAPEFPDAQIAAVIALCHGILDRHAIPARRVLAHSDVAPGRKIDPGPHFPWGRLSEAGVGVWPHPPVPGDDAGLAPGDRGEEVLKLQRDLAAYGYGVEETGTYDEMTCTVVSAFQLHFRPVRVDGRADASTLGALARLLATS